MEKIVDYYNFADNDYQYLKDSIQAGFVSNAMCGNAQHICERFLKSIIEPFAINLNDTDVIKTHNLKKLRRFIDKNISDFKCDWSIVLQADGYYYSARYPGDDSFFVDKDDVLTCWEAVKETKEAVDNYRANHKTKVSPMNAFDSFQSK